MKLRAPASRMQRAGRSLARAVYAISIVGLVFASRSPARADEQNDRELVAGGAWHAGPFVPCAAGVVTSVGPRLEEPPNAPPAERFSSGVSVGISLPSKPRFLNGISFSSARVVHYQGDVGNAAMAREKPGDHVQVCFVAFPNPRHDPQTRATLCDPNQDSRGLVFRVYDYARRAAYVGPDSQHSCGGA